MKILWLTNVPLPEVSALTGDKTVSIGGWLVESSKMISEMENIELAIAFPKSGLLNFESILGENIKYYAFKPIRDKEIDLDNNSVLEGILKDYKPDLVHIHGTELPQCLAMVNICEKIGIKFVISIQGLVSVIAKHTLANLPFKAKYGFTIRNILNKDNVVGLQKKFQKRGELEKIAIRKSKYIIGRTTWDKACTSQINPNAEYFLVNETLRESFYSSKWNIEECEKYSIFLSQGHYSIKGLHYVLEALPIILRKFPETKLYIGGKNILKSDSIRQRLLKSYYDIYIKKILIKNNLLKHVCFTGSLNEKEMCSKYLNSNVYINSSSIENSPNSLGEAMILGVPCVVSAVGGITDLINHKDEGYIYQADAPYMLAYYINEIFENKDVAISISSKARERANKIHDRKTNANNLIQVYKNIVNN